MTIDELKRREGLPVVVASGDGLIIEVNRRFQSVFGWTGAEVIGQPLTLIIPDAYHDAHNLGFSRFLSTGKATLIEQTLELQARTKAGVEFAADHFIVAERIDDAWVFAATIKPVERSKP